MHFFGVGMSNARKVGRMRAFGDGCPNTLPMVLQVWAKEGDACWRGVRCYDNWMHLTDSFGLAERYDAMKHENRTMNGVVAVVICRSVTR